MLLYGKRLVAFLPLNILIRKIALQNLCLHIVLQYGKQIVINNSVLQLLVIYWENCFNPPEEITRHPIPAPDV